MAGPDPGTEGFKYGDTRGVVLLIPCHLFHNLAATIVLKDYEIAKKGERPARVKNALQHHLQFGQSRVHQLLACNGSPRLEPITPRGQRADAGGDTVRDEQGLIEGKEGGPRGTVLRTFSWEVVL